MSEINDAAVEAGVAGVQERIAWASLHWGPVREVDASAWPHIARAALTAALPYLVPEPRVITTAEEMAALPVGIVVRSEGGTIACRYDERRGVVLGDERPFPWRVLDLPATVLYAPKETNRD